MSIIDKAMRKSQADVQALPPQDDSLPVPAPTAPQAGDGAPPEATLPVLMQVVADAAPPQADAAPDTTSSAWPATDVSPEPAPPSCRLPGGVRGPSR